MLRSKFFTAALLAATALLAAPAVSEASFLVRFTSGANPSDTFDLNALASPSSGSGAGFTYNGFNRTVTPPFTETSTIDLWYRGYHIVAAATLTNAPLGNPGELRLGSVTISRSAEYDAFGVGTGSGTLSVADLKIELTADGYTLPGSPRLMNVRFSGQWALTAGPGGVATFSAVYDNTNTLFGTNVSQSVTASADVVNPAFSTNVAGLSAPGSSTYSLTQTMTFTGFGIGIPNGFQGGNSDVTITAATPAPAGLVLVASVLPFVALLRRRLRKSDVATVA